MAADPSKLWKQLCFDLLEVHCPGFEYECEWREITEREFNWLGEDSSNENHPIYIHIQEWWDSLPLEKRLEPLQVQSKWRRQSLEYAIQAADYLDQCIATMKES